MPGTTKGRAPARRWRLPLVLAVAGVAALAVAQLPGSAPAGPVEAPPRTSGPETGPGSPAMAAPGARPTVRTEDRLHGPHVPVSDPVSVRIPALALSAPLTRLGLAPDGTLEVPQTGEEVGWFVGSATPGALGPAVIAAHVTWGGSRAAFSEVATLDRYDRVLVHRQDGRVAVFEVTDIDRFPKSRFPTEAVYGATDHAALRLITCAGAFDPASGRYPDNVVVFARLVGARR